MERLTKYQETEGGIPYVLLTHCEGDIVQDALQRLAAYEDTGLEPEGIKMALDGSVREFMEYDDLGPITHLRDLVQAEKDGRLVVLPCNVGDTVLVLMDDGTPYMARVQSISVSSAGNDTILRFGGYPAISVWGSDMGKTWFRSQKEAEEALKKEADNA